MLASHVVVAFAPLVSFPFASILFGAAATFAVVWLFGVQLRARRVRGATAKLEVGFEPFRLNGTVLETQSVADIGARPRQAPTDLRLVTVPLRVVNNGGQPATELRVVASVVAADRPNEVLTASEADQEPASGVHEGTRVNDGHIRFEIDNLEDVPKGKYLTLNVATWVPPGPTSFFVDYEATAAQADEVHGRLLVNVMA
jgi:hypothetical protein